MAGSRSVMRAVWASGAAELEAAQVELAAAELSPWSGCARDATIGAVAICFPRGQRGRGSAGDPAWAAAVVMRGRRTVAEATATGTTGAAYEPGLLALREGPLLEAAVRALPAAPDVLLVDATGRDHPRRAGLALHLGAVLDVPTVGVTHRPLLAQGEEPGPARGDSTPLTLDGEEVGAWVRRRPGARPLAVHPAWRTTLEVAVALARDAPGTHRTPEPLRRARRLARLSRAADRGDRPARD